MTTTNLEAAKAIGMRSDVNIHVATRNGISLLASAYFTPPFKIANITEDKSGPLHLMLMCSSPGVLDGDEQTIRITLDSHAQLQLHTQSYQRLFQMKQGATQTMEVCIGKDASFRWLPHPVVPYKNSIFKARNRIFLAEGAQLLWGEVLTCGRKLTGEVFTLSSYHVRTEIYIRDQLALLENMYLNPTTIRPGSLGQWEGYTHQASLLTNIKVVRTDIEEYLSTQKEMMYGITEGPASTLIIRILGNAAESLYDALKTIAALIPANPQPSANPSLTPQPPSHAS
jgi:urease accessory protein